MSIIPWLRNKYDLYMRKWLRGGHSWVVSMRLGGGGGVQFFFVLLFILQQICGEKRKLYSCYFRGVASWEQYQFRGIHCEVEQLRCLTIVFFEGSCCKVLFASLAGKISRSAWFQKNLHDTIFIYVFRLFVLGFTRTIHFIRKIFQERDGISGISLFSDKVNMLFGENSIFYGVFYYSIEFATYTNKIAAV